MTATAGPPGSVASAAVKVRPRSKRQSHRREIIRTDAVPERSEGSSFSSPWLACHREQEERRREARSSAPC